MTLLVNAPKAFVPSPLKVRDTNHETPCCGLKPAVAADTWRPKTSAGPRIYLAPPSREQETIVSVGESAPVPSRLAALVQSSAANRELISALTPAAGVAAVEVSEGFATPAASARTWRKRSSAVWPTKSTTRRPLSPGTEITIWRFVPLPCAVTSLSATPSELTRWRIIVTAWSTASVVILFASLEARGCSVTLVPPRRSRPRRTEDAP